MGHGERQRRRLLRRQKQEGKGKGKGDGENSPARNDDNNVDDGGGGHDDEAHESTSTSTGKLDDLADCMLQATAWTRWKENEMMLRRGQWQKLLSGRMG